MIGADKKRFENGAREYAAYLESFEGRLRTDLAFVNLEDVLSRFDEMRSLRVLDIGGGTGATAVRLARLGFHVTLLDSSEAMLEFARAAAQDAGLADKITRLPGDAMQLASLCQTQRFDVIVCHNLLEYLEDPIAVLRGAAGLLRDPSSVLSILVRNRAGEVFKSAILGGDLAGAEANLTAEWGCESLYGGSVRLFTPDNLRAMMKEASLNPISGRGVRVLADYLPERVSRTGEYARIFELEHQLGARPEFAAVARYLHCFAQRVGTMMETAP